MEDPPERRSDSPAQRSGSPHRPSSSFVGRDEELATLFELFARKDVRLITVIGVPGVGKTRLATEARDAAQDKLDLTSVFVPLAAVSDAAGIPAAIAKA
jgi:MoxR-like ATPase